MFVYAKNTTQYNVKILFVGNSHSDFHGVLPQYFKANVLEKYIE